MTKVILSDNSIYKLKEKERLTFGEVGIYIWDKPKNEDGSEQYPPKRFYVYGFVREVREDN